MGRGDFENDSLPEQKEEAYLTMLEKINRGVRDRAYAYSGDLKVPGPESVYNKNYFEEFHACRGAKGEEGVGLVGRDTS